MSASEVSVTLTCDNAAAEMLLVDSDFRLVAHGPPPLHARVQPGIYALKAKIGADVNEHLEVLEQRAEPYRFEIEAPEFESPIPLAKTRTHREYQQGSLEQFTGASVPAHTLGHGSALMIYVRDTTRRNFELSPEQQERYADNFRGMRLLDVNGDLLLNFGSNCVVQLGLGYAGLQVHLDPGSYVLSCSHGDSQICLAVNTVPGWMMQVYLRLQPVSAGAIEMRPDFAEAAFAYDRLGASYSAYRDDYRPMEALRLALLHRRNVVSGQMLRELLEGKYENPMLGLYAAHLMLVDQNRDPAILGMVIANTATLLGATYPDLLPVAWGYEVATGKRPAGYDARPWQELLPEVMGPPLLTLSWDLLLNCAEANGVSIECLPAFAAAGNLAVSGSVLTWKGFRRVACPVAAKPAEPAAAAGCDASAVGDRLAAPVAARRPATAPQPGPASVAARPPSSRAPGSIFGRLGSAIWNAVGKPLLTRRADGTIAEVPKLEIKELTIDTPAAAAQAMQQLATKVPWHEIVRFFVTNAGTEHELLGSISAIQRDLLHALARASANPAVLAALDSDYMSGVMHTHRVPITTVASALRGLDYLAVSSEIIRRIKANLRSKKSTPAGAA